MIRTVLPKDAKAISDLYNYYIRESTATFEEVVLDASEMEKRIQAHKPEYWLVFEQSSEILGFAYAKPWKERSAYRYTMEISVYIDPKHHRKGIAQSLYELLLDRLKVEGIHAVIAGITLPNPSSIDFHESLGFTKVAHFRETGFKFGRWIDVGYWEKTLS